MTRRTFLRVSAAIAALPILGKLFVKAAPKALATTSIFVIEPEKKMYTLTSFDDEPTTVTVENMGDMSEGGQPFHFASRLKHAGPGNMRVELWRGSNCARTYLRPADDWQNVVLSV